MKTQILNQTKNPLLNREELQVEIKSQATPSFEQVKAALEKDPELTIIKRIDSNFGTKTFHADVVVYDNKEAKDRVEPKSKKKQEAPAQPSPAPATPTEQPKQEEQKTEPTADSGSQTETKPEMSEPEASQESPKETEDGN